MHPYLQGFLAKCAQEGVDPAELVKTYLASGKGDPDLGRRQFESALDAAGIGLGDFGLKSIDQLAAAKQEALDRYAQTNPDAARNVNAMLARGNPYASTYQRIRHPIASRAYQMFSGGKFQPFLASVAKRRPGIFAAPKPAPAKPVAPANEVKVPAAPPPSPATPASTAPPIGQQPGLIVSGSAKSAAEKKPQYVGKGQKPPTAAEKAKAYAALPAFLGGPTAYGILALGGEGSEAEVEKGIEMARKAIRQKRVLQAPAYDVNLGLLDRIAERLHRGTAYWYNPTTEVVSTPMKPMLGPLAHELGHADFQATALGKVLMHSRNPGALLGSLAALPMIFDKSQQRGKLEAGLSFAGFLPMLAQELAASGYGVGRLAREGVPWHGRFGPFLGVPTYLAAAAAGPLLHWQKQKMHQYNKE